MHESQVNLISLCCVKQIITINQHTISLVTNLIRNLECVRLIVVRKKKCEKVSLRRVSLCYHDFWNTLGLILSILFQEYSQSKTPLMLYSVPWPAILSPLL